jgi:hypothetical protein
VAVQCKNEEEEVELVQDEREGRRSVETEDAERWKGV